MGRIFNPESAGKERARLTKALVVAIRELAMQPEPNDTIRDLVAFIILALERISESIDITVAAWEKRDFWVKADRFRMKWSWSGSLSVKLKEALKNEDWVGVAGIVARIGGQLKDVQVSRSHRLGNPWIGAWDELNRRPPET